MAKRRGRTPDEEIKKNRMEFYKLECGNERHQWHTTTSDGWKRCGICGAVEFEGETYPEKPNTKKRYITIKEQASLWE